MANGASASGFCIFARRCAKTLFAETAVASGLYLVGNTTSNVGYATCRVMSYWPCIGSNVERGLCE